MTGLSQRVAFGAYAASYFLFSRDTPSSAPPTSTPSDAGGRSVVSKVVFFIRHGESEWNAIVNRGGPGWLGRAVKTTVGEMYLAVADPTDSRLADSPLSTRGKRQTVALREFVASNMALFPTATESKIYASNLRRAMETASTGLAARLAVSRERIIVHSALQEASRNVDALTISTTPGVVASADEAVFDSSKNAGQKTFSGDVHVRIDEMNQQIFGDAAPAAILVGHSMWFLTYFARYLPQSSVHPSKSHKMGNCDVVRFSVTQHANGQIVIDEASIQSLFQCPACAS